MLKRILLIVFCSVFTISYSQHLSDDCTSILVTKGASQDSSVMITYACDAEFLPELKYTPAADHKENEYFEFDDKYGGKVKIKQIPHTYAVVGLMNEHQVAIGETTTGGRKELQNPDGLLHYYTIMQLVLQRAKTAKECIQVIVDLVEEYGYGSTMESFSISDPNEAWIMEIIGTGPGGKGAIWVALRVPDGYVSCYANISRIGEIPFKDKKNCMYSKNVKSFAIEKGYYDPSSGDPFLFNKAYGAIDPLGLKLCSARIWSVFNRCAPSLNLSSDYHRAVEGTKPYPLWIKPDEKLSVQDVFALTRDHFEGTKFDMTKGIDAGAFGSPYRWRPLTWEIDSVKYCWERSVATQQTAFSFVSQSRSWLPNPIGGLYWYGIDDAYTTCFVPFYCSVTNIPDVYKSGDLQNFSWNSAWWVFNFVSNYANLKYSYMIADIQSVQSELEGIAITSQPAIEQAALALYKTNPQLMEYYLTNYCISHADNVVKRWIDLGEHLITKYNDGYVKDENGKPKEVGYSESWLREVVKSQPDKFLLKEQE
ncbi:dipeptidase [Candidatus Neomarinimicrobiota bacterium]